MRNTGSLDTGLLDAIALAKILRLDRQTIYRLARDRDLPCVRISRRCVRFERDSVAKWLQEKQRD
jgi:excisionase family DNA binding protein